MSAAATHEIRGLYLVTADAGPGRDHVALAAAALRGGARVVQFREKRRDASAYVEQARGVQALCSAAGVPFIVNDDAELAMSLRADGLHVGWSDVGALDAWQPSWPAVLGVSAATLEETREAVGLGADYIGAGPVFATATKTDAAPPMGLAMLAQLCAESPVPVAAIGGIDASNAADVIAAGCVSACVISAITGASDPERAARELNATVEAAIGRDRRQS